MLTVNLICVGKLKESYLRDACSEYIKRLSSFCKVNIIEIAECKLPNLPSNAEILRGIDVEYGLILPKLKGYIIPLCIEGNQLSSEQLSEKISMLMLDGISELSFVIGGSFGLSDSIKLSCDFKLSMSAMTFPHQLARVMLLEQIYRCFQINNNGKYHK